jgi:hypothetical protein
MAIGFATTGATLLATVGLFVADRILTRREGRREVRRQLMVRVLDAFDSSTRGLIRPAFVQAWTNDNLEYALLAPRLLLDLNGRERVIALWLQTQVQQMMLAVSRAERLRIRATVAERMIAWHVGEIRTSWFGREVGRRPIVRDLRIPPHVRVRQVARDSWSWAQLIAAVAGMALVVRQVVVK